MRKKVKSRTCPPILQARVEHQYGPLPGSEVASIVWRCRLMDPIAAFYDKAIKSIAGR
jgi:hypothetical protein